MRLSIFSLFLVAALTATGLQVICGAETSPDRLFGKFVGSTPRGPQVAALLSLPTNDVIECTWAIELFVNADQSPSTYRLLCEHGKYSYQKPKVEQKREALTKNGKWKLGKSEKTPHLRTFELEGGPTLLEVSENVLHFAGDQGAFLVGGGGYSYTLFRADATEKPGDWHLAMAKPDSPPYKIAPVATGENVYGVFEGRTPYKGIAQQLKHAWDEGNVKAKWRVTLYQDEKTKTPSEYKIEGTLFNSTPRTGQWTMEKAERGKLARIVLSPAAGQPELVLIAGDDNILFIADPKGQPLIGHSDFSYTMNRRATVK